MIDGIEGGLENRTCIFISPSESYLEVWQQWFKFKFSEFLEWEQLLLDTSTYSAVIQVQARNVSLQSIWPLPWHFLIYHLNYKWEASQFQKYLKINQLIDPIKHPLWYTFRNKTFSCHIMSPSPPSSSSSSFCVLWKVQHDMIIWNMCFI